MKKKILLLACGVLMVLILASRRLDMLSQAKTNISLSLTLPPLKSLSVFTGSLQAVIVGVISRQS